MKIKSLIILVLVAIFTFGATSCSKEAPQENTDYSHEIIQKVVLNDFSKYGYLAQLTNDYLFGITSLNTDKKFVKTGEMSAKLQPIGNFGSTAILKQKMQTNTYGIDNDFKDITKLTNITTEIYNDSDKVVRIFICLEFTTISDRSSLVAFDLQPKVWNAINLPISSSALALSFDVKDCKYIVFSFESYDGKEIPSLYMDNITLTISPKTPEEINMVVDDKNEILSFDHLYQQYILTSSCSGMPEIAPTLSLNTDPTYSQNGFSLKAIYPKGVAKNAHWTFINVLEKYVKLTDIRNAKLNDKFVFDVYNDSNTSISLGVVWRQGNSEIINTLHITISPKAWTKCSFSIADINAKVIANNQDLEKNGVKVMTDFRLSVGEFVDAEEKTLYFDSFRIERAE